MLLQINISPPYKYLDISINGLPVLPQISFSDSKFFSPDFALRLLVAGHKLQGSKFFPVYQVNDLSPGMTPYVEVKQGRPPVRCVRKPFHNL